MTDENLPALLQLRPAALTLAALIDAYRSDEVSPYHQLRYTTKENTDNLLRRLHEQRGSVFIADIKFTMLKRWQLAWSADGKISMTHSFFAQLRTLIGFGLSYLEDAECARVAMVLRQMKIPNGEPRTVYLTAEQADLIRHHARTAQLASMALAQAIMFECALRQKDVIGQFVPQYAEPGESDVLWRGKKWLRGARWEEIDENLILRHVMSKSRKGKVATHDLKLAPMVLDEFARAYPGLVLRDAVIDEDGEMISEMMVDRSVLPKSGPIVVHEESGRPWPTAKFRATWRQIARGAGIPDNVQNRDSRSGAATEADIHGASREDTQQLLGHSNAATTAIYVREKTRAAAKAQRKRISKRLKSA